MKPGLNGALLWKVSLQGEEVVMALPVRGGHLWRSWPCVHLFLANVFWMNLLSSEIHLGNLTQHRWSLLLPDAFNTAPTLTSCGGRHHVSDLRWGRRRRVWHLELFDVFVTLWLSFVLSTFHILLRRLWHLMARECSSQLQPHFLIYAEKMAAALRKAS